MVDDRPDILEVHQQILEPEGFEITAVLQPEKAIELLRQKYFDLVVLDDRMPSMSGRELLAKCREFAPDLGAIFISAYADADMLTEIIRLGATDFLPKGSTSNDEIVRAVHRALESTRHARQWRWYRTQLAPNPGLSSFVAVSPAMRKLLGTIQKLAAGPAFDVLVTGETGTGKEVIADLLHRMSPRRHGPFLSCNLGAFSSEVISAELFGTAKGGFTGAVDKPGLFEAADGGTLLLDEIGEMPLDQQQMLLRVLEKRQLQAVGDSTRTRDFDARVIAATHHDLQQDVLAKSFREDLLERLRTFELKLPPLRERQEDIEPLAFQLLENLAKEYGTSAPELSEATLRALRSHAWPRNVRELRNCLRRAYVLCEGRAIQPDDLGLSDATWEQLAGHDYETAKQHFDRQYFKALLTATSDNRSKAAQLAGISRDTLYRYLRACGLNANS